MSANQKRLLEHCCLLHRSALTGRSLSAIGFHLIIRTLAERLVPPYMIVDSYAATTIVFAAHLKRQSVQARASAPKERITATEPPRPSFVGTAVLLAGASLICFAGCRSLGTCSQARLIYQPVHHGILEEKVVPAGASAVCCRKLARRPEIVEAEATAIAEAHNRFSARRRVALGNSAK